MDALAFMRKSRLDKRFLNDDHILLSTARKGVSPKVAQYLLNLSGATKASLEPLLPETYKNMTRKIKLEMYASERILMISRVFVKGHSVFGKTEKLKSWLSRYNPFLGAMPFEILNTTTGCNAVLDELTRIEEGILA